MKQVARNLTDRWDGFLLGKRYLIHDRARRYVGSREMQALSPSAFQPRVQI
jgi:hypothetical protein